MQDQCFDRSTEGALLPLAQSACQIADLGSDRLAHQVHDGSESITLLQHAELNAGRFVEMINDSIFPGAVYSGYGNAIATNTYTPPGFTTTLGLKDLNLALGTAAELGVDLPAGPVLHDVFATAVEQIGADLDWASVAEVIRQRSTGRPHW